MRREDRILFVCTMHAACNAWESNKIFDEQFQFIRFSLLLLIIIMVWIACDCVTNNLLVFALGKQSIAFCARLQNVYHSLLFAINSHVRKMGWKQWFPILFSWHFAHKTQIFSVSHQSRNQSTAFYEEHIIFGWHRNRFILMGIHPFKTVNETEWFRFIDQNFKVPLVLLFFF